jgi:hypothetical protein
MDPGDLEIFFLLNQGDLEMLLGDLSTVITVSGVYPYIHILHSSLRDFLLDAARSKDFYIELSSIHTACMHLCFQHNTKCLSTYFPLTDAVTYLHLIDLASDEDGGRSHFIYAGRNLLWHCENTPPSAHSQLHEEIRNFSFARPDSCFKPPPGMSLLVSVPRFLEFIKALVCPICLLVYPNILNTWNQPIEDADKLYSQNLATVLNSFASKLQLYYSSSRLTLLLTFLQASKSNNLRTYVIPLPSRLKIIDDNAFNLHRAGGSYAGDCCWKIFQDFLASSDPQALDKQKYAIASLACLKILFGLYKAPVLCFTWFSQHLCTPMVDMEHHLHWHHTDFLVGTDWRRSIPLYWELRTHLPNQLRQGRHRSGADILYDLMSTQTRQRRCSKHLQFLLEKSAYSDNILGFARHKVFRFGYLARHHPAYMKKAIFSLAKYIQRVTGETAEVRTCESIWGRDRWFTTQ